MTNARIALEDDVIRFSSESYGSWDMPVDEIRLIGEAANQNGPLAEDWFLCVASDGTGWLEAPMDSLGRDAFLAALGNRLGMELSPGLALSTDFTSRILWPPSVRGEPMFCYTDVPSQFFVGRLLGIGENKQTFSDTALRVLEAR